VTTVQDEAPAKSPNELARPGLGQTLWNLPSSLLIGMVWLYQQTLRRLIGLVFGRVCRFEPSCSQYFIGAVKKYGAVRGSLRGVGRICRCHPFHPGGYDPP